MFAQFFSLIVAPIIVGTVNTLFSHWLKENDKDDNRKH
ncbi:type I toxin-antitoxin system Fst family toxin [Ligilactobacillus pobuzihii]|nr:type I toxin-antitoxin system Fst family toxin [Ligilactobacillus pobuzihii]MBN7273583.1 type I toxin-antitoxin system Fst family toxin [Ligilactobacillus pobuzihii]HIZ96892.1 type I toxin-antitoxin system Fst family toxin [Candidatus Ligilactobacillus excrementavium]